MLKMTDKEVISFRAKVSARRCVNICKVCMHVALLVIATNNYVPDGIHSSRFSNDI